MEKRYSVLRIIGTIFKVLGVLVGILAVLGALVLCGGALVGSASIANAGREAGVPFLSGVAGAVIGGIFSLLFGLIYAMGLIAVGDFIYVLLSIEENTRATSAMLRAPAGPPAATTYPPPPLR